MARQPSLQSKISFGYYLVGSLIVGLSLFTFYELRLLGENILAGERVTEFFDGALELRRFEKNYFLYHQQADYFETVRLTEQLRTQLDADRSELARHTDTRRLEELYKALREYPDVMARYAEAYPLSASRAQQAALGVRQRGKIIIGVGEEIARAERRGLQQSLEQQRALLMISVIAITVVVIGLGRVLSRRVVRTLKHVETSMEAVAGGAPGSLHIPSMDREIVSLSAAFNHVLTELEVRQRHLLRAEKLAALGTLLSGVAHELNNPLSNISTSCQILLEELDDIDRESSRELLEQIDEQTLRARNIVRSLLDFARDRVPSREILPLARLVNETVRFLRGQVPTAVVVTIDIAPEIVVLGDKQRLQQAFLNLLKNAVEAVQGDGTVMVRAARRRIADAMETPAAGTVDFIGACNARGEVVEIEVTDTGAGIPPEVQARIFDPFFTTKDVGQGSGLGLFIVFEIIEDHDGCIGVSSASGVGTTFHIRLPAPDIAGGKEAQG